MKKCHKNKPVHTRLSAKYLALTMLRTEACWWDSKCAVTYLPSTCSVANLDPGNITALNTLQVVLLKSVHIILMELGS